MLLSMTGFGQGRRECDDHTVTVEVRTVNNRYLKINTKLPESFAPLEGLVERIVRSRVARGTITVTLRIEWLTSGQRVGFDRDAAAHFWRELKQLAEMLKAPLPADLGCVVELPGVVRSEDHAPLDLQREEPLVEEAVREALERLGEFRRAEGLSMESDLREQTAVVAARLESVSELAPEIVGQQRQRILDRIGEYLASHDVEVQPSDLIREVAIFADRCDVNEEITRLRTHLEQFESFLTADTSQGRKLDFLTQEMFREVNTIGSKGNNVRIAHEVVEMKAAVERIREVLQNVE